VVLASILFGVALPLLPVQILWVNMVTVIALELVLTLEPKPVFRTFPIEKKA
jgi:cation-transporting ATPase F